jgi:alpha-tubulin suppressor-like RCC1 family protein
MAAQVDTDDIEKLLEELEEMEMPNYDAPGTVVASAGLTAVVGQVGGTLYTFGLNNRGQCGVGYTSNNEWVPQQVMGLSEDFASQGREYLQQALPITQVALGLQHGYALDARGNLFAWGKGERSQLGQDNTANEHSSGNTDGSISEFGRHIRKAFTLDAEERPDFFFLPRIQQVASGFHHGAALAYDTNQVLVWGKNVMPPLEYDRRQGKLASDARAPTPLLQTGGLPAHLKIVDIACGSHHTSLLMEDGSVYGVGIANDHHHPESSNNSNSHDILFEPVLQVPPGIIDMPCRQFEAHFDRTTVVGKDGSQVLQFHLWKDPELRDYGIFTPFWVDLLLEEQLTIRSVHRGWLHTLVVTDKEELLEHDTTATTMKRIGKKNEQDAELPPPPS